MADNVLIQPASSVSAVPVAADEIAGTKHQRAKVQYGDDGSATDVSTTNPLPVTQQGAVILPTGASSETKLEQVRALLAGDQAAKPRLYNGATYDDARGNLEGTLFATASRTGFQNSPTIVNHNARGVVISFVSTVNGTGSAAIRIVGLVGGTMATYLTAVYNVVSPSTSIKHGIELYPGATGAIAIANHVQQRTSGSLPRSWYVEVNTSDAWTYAASYSLIV